MNNLLTIVRRDACHLRCLHFAGVAGLALLAVLWLLTFAVVCADDGSTSGIVVVPLDEEAQGVHLATQSIDLRFLGDADSCMAETNALLRLSNLSAKPITVTLTVEGGPLTSEDTVDLSVSLGKRVLASATITDSVAFFTSIGIPATSTVDVRYQVTQTVPVFDGIVDYKLPLAATDLWAGTPESARVTVHYEQPVSFASVFAVSPTPPLRTPSMMEWQWEQQRLLEDIRLVFAMPDWWADVAENRVAASSPSARAENHLQFASDLQRLARLPAERHAISNTVAARYRSASIAELQLALATTPSETAAHKAHVQLGRLFLESAHAESDALREYYFQLAEDEANADMLAASNVEARQLLEEIETARLNSTDASIAAQSPSALADVATMDDATRRAYDLASASLLALRAGQTVKARSILSELVDESAWLGTVDPPPAAEQAILTVRMSPRERSYELALLGGENRESARALLDTAARVVETHGAAEVVRDGDILRFSILFGVEDDPDGLSHTLAAALPEDSEMSLLRTFLSGSRADFRYENEDTATLASYGESVDTLDAWLEWNNTAERLDRTAETPAQLDGLSPAVMSQLMSIRSELLGSYARGWRALSSSSKVIVELRSDDAGVVERQWILPVGSACILFWEQPTVPSLLVLRQKSELAWAELLGR